LIRQTDLTFHIDVIHYNPVCLNSLLYLMEQQTARMLVEVVRVMRRQVRELARQRAERIK